MNRLRQLHEAGVSIWLDTLSRELLETGDFVALVDGSAVTGATSNPTIFAKAITGSDRYDGQLRSLIASGEHEGRELFFAIALDDVRRAAAILRPAHDRSGGQDGFVSFECTPDVADDTEATLRAFADHGSVEPALGPDLSTARGVLAAVGAEEVDLDAITAELEHEGVRAFSDSYAELLQCIEGRRGALTAVS